MSSEFDNVGLRPLADGNVRTFHAPAWDLERALAVKGESTISVCLPCRNEEATIGALVAEMRKKLVDTVPFVDEIVVLDDRSHDHTAEVARDEGAVVVPVDEVVHPFAPGRGKGNVLWSSLLVSTGDIVVWCDADLTSFTADWIVRLSYPLLIDPTVNLVKAFYERPTDSAGWGGGRNTELVARPMLSMLYPKLAGVYQPLAGEMAGRRTALEALPFVQGWGVEVAMLIETLERFGASSIAQVDLGIRKHRHRPLDDLSVQAAEIMLTLLQRSGRAGPGELRQQLERANGELVALNVATRPPVDSLRRS